MNKDRELIEIARIGDLRRIEELLSQGADIHANNDDALRWAANHGHLEVVRYLVERGGYSIEELLTHSEGAVRSCGLKEYRDG